MTADRYAVMLRRSLCIGAGLILSACSPSADPTANRSTAAPQPSVTPMSEPRPTPSATPTGRYPVLGLEGLGALKIGQPVPAGSGWAERPGQMDGPCRVILSPEYVGVYAIVENGKVARITIGATSNVRLAEGITYDSPEKDVRSWFGGFREEPHKYEPAPAKYLTAPNAASGDPALRFEIGQNRRVSAIHVGTMPVLGYVEGCA